MQKDPHGVVLRCQLRLRAGLTGPNGQLTFV